MAKRIDRPEIDLPGNIISILRFPQDLPPNNASTRPPKDLEGHFALVCRLEDRSGHIEAHRTFPYANQKRKRHVY
jgi:hypothetical protein